MTTLSALALCLEDLHWADDSTLDWIASFARRPEPARVVVLGTFRPGESLVGRGSPETLARELAMRGLCTEIALAPLDRGALRAYVFARFPAAPESEPAMDRLTELIAQRTDGNPLFVVNVLDDLVARGTLVGRDGAWTPSREIDADLEAIPADLRQAIERQIDRLDAGDQQLLEVASLAGHTFPAALVAAAARLAPADVEVAFDGLVRRHAFIRRGPHIEWPDGTISGSYEFLHALYHDILRSRVSPARGAELHRLIAARLESAYGDRTSDIAAELAAHCEESRDLQRAVVYLQHAAETDRSRSAHEAARQRYNRALSLLDRLPVGDERDQREMALRVGLGTVLMQTSGWGAPDVQSTYERVRELSERRDHGRAALPALWNLWIYYVTRGELTEARALADRLVVRAEQTADPQELLQAHHARWSTLFALGDLDGTEAHAREGIRLSGRVPASLTFGGHDAGVCARVFGARALALRGAGSAANSMCDEAVHLAREADHPFTLAFALMHGAAVKETCRNAQVGRAYAEEATRLSAERNLRLMHAWASGFLGWSLVELGDARAGLGLLDEATRSARAIGALMFLPHLLGLRVHALAANGLEAEALATVDDALMIGRRTGERFYAAELHRIRGERRLAHRTSAAARRLAEQDFHTAQRIAEEAGAHLLAWRAAVSLARLWREDGRNTDADELVLAARHPLVEDASGVTP
jgi:predicted ATPase